MPDLIVPFITGLTAGGLSCLAVQGGLLTSSIAKQAEQDVQSALAARKRKPAPAPQRTALSRHNAKRKSAKQKHKTAAIQPVEQNAPSAAAAQRGATVTVPHHAALPIAVFLGGKLVAYTVLGALLGALGSVFELSPTTQGMVQLAVGIFMIGNALRMLNVHPIFRWFVIEPPKVVTRYIRQVSKNSTGDFATPAFLGALTVLIPCGVTQTMMALAIGAGNPLAGAAIMFAFTLGASPVFFGLAYLATRLGEKLEAGFLKFVAVATLALGLFSLNAAFNVLGSPLTDLIAPAPSFASSASSAMGPVSSVEAAASESPSGARDNALVINATASGYVPSALRAKAGVPVKLTLVTNRMFG